MICALRQSLTNLYVVCPGVFESFRRCFSFTPRGGAVTPRGGRSPDTSPPPRIADFYKSSSSILTGATGANGNEGGSEAAPAAAAADGSLGAVVYPLLGVNRPTD